MKLKIAYYISSHGYGHLIRSLALIRFLLTKKITDFPPEEFDFFFYDKSDIDFDITIIIDNERHASLIRKDPYLKDIHIINSNYDIAIKTSDLIDIDIKETVNDFRKFINKADHHIDDQCRVIRKHGFDLIISDIGFVPIASAGLCKLPSYILGNFTWEEVFYDYLQKGYNVYKSDILYLLDCYNMAKIYFQLPLSLKFRLNTRMVPIGFITRKSLHCGNLIREKLNLISENAYIFDTLDLQGKYGFEYNLEGFPENYKFIIWNRYDKPINNERFIYINEKDFDFEEALAACDIIFGKPGYNLLSQAIIYNKKTLLINRRGFIETDTILRKGRKFINIELIEEPSLDYFTEDEFSKTIKKLSILKKPIRVKPPLFGEIDFYKTLDREI